MSEDFIDVNIDLVLCIDATSNMNFVIDKIKHNAIKFYTMFVAAEMNGGCIVKNLRIKVILFHDYWSKDDNDAITESRFFSMPLDSREFNNFLSGIHATGGIHEKSNGLEALALAMNSDWIIDIEDKQQIIIMMTDKTAYPLDEMCDGKVSNYIMNIIPNTFTELSKMWHDASGKMDYQTKRLIIFAPDAYPWSDIGTKWIQTTHVISKTGNGLRDVDADTIIHCSTIDI